MTALQKRAVDERDDLVEKRDWYEEFVKSPVFQTLDDAEQKRLVVQLGLMNGYVDVLHERILSFP